ncbi:MAG: hypothetical protein NTV84_10810, partial [Methanoregula sp.]|nr:hypothetical protein [Methanoregula sp.]
DASRGSTYTGLLEKCPAIAYTDRTIVVNDELTGGSTRRRTNAYMFDQEIFGKWGGNAGVWIKEDNEACGTSGNVYCSAPLQSHCNPSAIAEHNEMSKTSPDLANNSYNTNLDLSNNLSHCKSEIIREPVNVNTSSITSSSDIGVAVG